MPRIDGSLSAVPVAKASGLQQLAAEELEELLKAYHEQLFARLSGRLEAAEERIISKVLGPDFDNGDCLISPASVAAAAMNTHWTSPSVSHTPNKVAFEQPSPEEKKRSDDSIIVDPEDHDRQLNERAQDVAQNLHQDRDSELKADRGRRLTWSHRVVADPRFEVFMGATICTNAVFIGMQTDWEAKSLGMALPLPYEVLGTFYTLLFTFELFIRFHAAGLSFLRCQESSSWNYLDVFIVASSLVELAISTFVTTEGSAGQGSMSSSQFRILRIVRVTRLIRMIRMARIIRAVRALRIMVHQMVLTLRSLGWAIILLVLVIYLFGICFTQAVTAHRLGTGCDAAVAGTAAAEACEDLNHRYWGTLSRSMFTLYQAMTSGIDWGEVAGPLGDLGGAIVFVFIAYIFFTQLAVLNVLTGVFCQSAMDSAAHDQDLATQAMLADKQVYIRRIKSIFKDIDVDSNGTVTLQEFKQHLEHEHVKAYFETLELDTSDVWTLFKLMDTDEGCIIDLEDFVSGCMRLRGQAKAIDIAKLSYEHKFMATRMARFIKRTDEAFGFLLPPGVPLASHASRATTRVSEDNGKPLASNDVHNGATERSRV